jgi:hypothetical protein
MKKKATKISKKNIISIREYCETFLNLKYKWKGKLTHDRLREYAFEKHTLLPKRCIFDDITKEDILKGNCYFVKDETGKVIAYKGKMLLTSDLLEDLKREKFKLEERRKNNLSKQGYKVAKYGNVIKAGEIDIDYYEDIEFNNLGSLLEKNNREKRLNYKRR